MLVTGRRKVKEVDVDEKKTDDSDLQAPRSRMKDSAVDWSENITQEEEEERGFEERKKVNT